MKLRKTLATTLCIVLLATLTPKTIFAEDAQTSITACSQTKESVQEEPVEATEKPTEKPDEAPSPKPDEPFVSTPEQTAQPSSDADEAAGSEPTKNPEATPSAEPAGNPSPEPVPEPAGDPPPDPAPEPAGDPSPEPTVDPAADTGNSFTCIAEVQDADALNGTATFTVIVETDYPGVLLYQWQRLNIAEFEASQPADEADFWLDIEGENTETLIVENIDQDNFQKFLYRCKVAAGEFVAISKSAEISSVELKKKQLIAKDGSLIDSGGCWAYDNDRKWYFYSDGTLKISGSGKMPDYSNDYLGTHAPWDKYLEQIRNIVIEKGITSVGNDAFENCAVVNVSLPTGLTSIGNGAFDHCRSLKVCSFPTGLVSIGDRAFSESGLTEAHFSAGLKTVGVFAFSGSLLETVSFETGLETICYGAFGSCAKLQNVTLPNGMESIGEWAFERCTLLKSITIPNGITSIEKGTFEGCGQLETVVLPAALENIGNSAFAGCDLSDFNIPDAVVSIGTRAFFGCGFESISLPDGLASIQDSTFSNCTHLVTVNLPTSLITIGENAFSDCSSLQNIVLPSKLTSIGKYAFNKCTSLVSINIPASMVDLVSDAFYNCNLRKLVLDEGLKTIGREWFSGFKNLQTVQFPNSLTRIGDYAFARCENLTSIAIHPSVTEIGYGAFSSCTRLASITLPEGLKTIEGLAFEYCSNLTEIILPSTLEGYLSCFSNCVRLTSIAVPSGITNMDYTFSGCTNLTSVSLPEGLERIGEGTFDNCSSLARVDIPSSVKVIDDYAFFGCKKLQSISIPAGVAAIGEETFFNCTNLKSILIPASVQTIEKNAFAKCGKLKTIYWTGNRSNWNALLARGVKSGNGVLKSAKVYYHLSGAEISVPEQEYGINSITPKVSVKYHGLLLKEGSDYRISGFQDNTNAGTASVTVTGIGSYAGTRTGTFAIVPKDISQCMIGAVGERTDSGVTASITVTVSDGERVLVEGTDYRFELETGSERVAVTGMGNYTGMILKTISWTHVLAAGSSGDGLTWTLYGSGRLVIDSNGTMPDSVPWASVRDSITSVSIGAGVTEISGGAFDGCDMLKSFSVVYGNPFYKSVGGALLSADGAMLLRCPCALTGAYQIPAGVTRVAKGAFDGCDGLESIALSASVTAVDAGAFDGCVGLQTIVVPYANSAFRAVDGVLFSRDGGMILRCPEGRTGEYAVPLSASNIAAGAFSGCRGLSDISLGAGVVSIGESAFDDCASLASVRFAGTKDEWQNLLDAADAGNGALESARVRYDVGAYTIAFGQGSYPYTGEPVEPTEIVVSRGNTVLTQGADYEISGYHKNDTPGDGILTISGINDYTGTKNASFKISHPYALSVWLPLSEATIGVEQKVDAIAKHACVLPESAANRALIWTSSDESIATVDASTGMITGIRAGSCVITASSADTHSTASTTVTLTVVAKRRGVTGIRLNASSLTAYPGKRVTLSAALTPSAPANASVLWSSSDESVATVSGGVVTVNKTGSVTINAIASSGVVASCEIEVVSGYDTLILDKEALTVGVGELHPLEYTVGFPNGSGEDAVQDAIFFESSNPRIASVDAATGVVRGNRAGTAMVKARTDSGLFASCAVTVKKAPSRVAITAERTTVGAGERLTLAASFPAGMGGSVVWSLPEDQKALAGIDPVTGVLTTGARTGTVTPCATTYNGRTTMNTVAIVPAPTYIALHNTEITLCAGDVHALSYTLSFGSAGKVGFSSLDAAVATVSADGVVTAGQSIGQTIVRVETYNGKYDVCTVKVVEAPASLALSMDGTTLGVGETRGITRVFAPINNPCTIDYATSSAKVATVTADGIVRGVKPGSVTITATAYNGVKQSIAVTVKSAPSSITLTCPPAVGLGETVDLHLATNAGSFGSIALTSSDPSILRINVDGTASAMALGSATVTAATYNNKVTSKMLSVRPAPTESTFDVLIDDGFDGLTINKDYRGDSLSAAMGDRSSVTPSFRDEAIGSVSFSSSNASIVVIDNAGKIRFVGVGEADITCTTYNGITRRIPIEVLAAPSKISLDAEDMAVFNESSYSIKLRESGETLEDRYDIIHYSVTSSNTSVVRASRSDETLKANRRGSSTITVKLFNGAKAEKKVSVHRNKMDRIEKRPSVYDAEYAVPEIWFKSVEVLSLKKIAVEFYVANNRSYRLRNLTGVDLAFEADGVRIFDQVFKSITINAPPYSVKTIKMIISGSDNIDDLGVSLTDLSKCSPDNVQYWGDYDDAYWTR